MPTTREIAHRIRSVKSIRQITRALEAVSASKVRRAQEAVQATRSYAQKARDVLASVAARAVGDARHPLLSQRDPVNHISILLVSSDRGLCGAFNSNVARAAFDLAHRAGKPASFVTIGRKGRDFVYRRGGRVVADFPNLPARPTLPDTTAAARSLIDDFLDEQADEVYLVYTEFVSMALQHPVARRLLPLPVDEALAGRRATGPRPVYEFEPGPEEILDTLLPRLTEFQLFEAVLESQASEHAARMLAMRNATDSASDLIAALTLSYNKARQQGITGELLDITGGAEALGSSRAGPGAMAR
jgi:F-type H+-transporting ATPase subunit gamma